MLKRANKNLVSILESEHSYFISDSKNVVFSLKETNSEKKGIYKKSFPRFSEERIRYCFTDVEKKKLKFELNINYSVGADHIQTKIINAKLLSLGIEGYSSGELIVENSKIDNLRIYNFSTELGANFYNIKPFRHELIDNQFEIQNTNLDKVWFDNVAFNDYSIVSIYRNKFGQTTITSCGFPESFQEFDKFKTEESMQNTFDLNDNYYKTRYNTFIQLKKVLEASGNLYEAQKFHSLSNDALKEIKNLPFNDRLILKINSLSNNHGISIKKPFFGIFIFSISFYILYLLGIGKIFNHNPFDFNLIGYYFSFLDITHRSDFLVNNKELNGFCIAIDYLNKIIVGFFIYQFISSFRKYGKK